jgi:acyl-CoA synthetase (AMP-forming)/AMP-acid ligase II
LLEAFERRGITVRHLWGMTEVSPLGSQGGIKGTLGELSFEQKLAVQAKQGRPHVFLDMRIVDDDVRELPRDGKAVGNLQVRGPICVQQYFKVAKLQDARELPDTQEQFVCAPKSAGRGRACLLRGGMRTARVLRDQLVAMRRMNGSEFHCTGGRRRQSGRREVV